LAVSWFGGVFLGDRLLIFVDAKGISGWMIDEIGNHVDGADGAAIEYHVYTSAPMPREGAPIAGGGIFGILGEDGVSIIPRCLLLLPTERAIIRIERVANISRKNCPARVFDIRESVSVPAEFRFSVDALQVIMQPRRNVDPIRGWREEFLPIKGGVTDISWTAQHFEIRRISKIRH